MLVVDCIDLPVPMHPIEAQTKDRSVADLHVKVIQRETPFFRPPAPRRAPRSGGVDDSTASDGAANGLGLPLAKLHFGANRRPQGADGEGGTQPPFFEPRFLFP